MDCSEDDDDDDDSCDDSDSEGEEEEEEGESDGEEPEGVKKAAAAMAVGVGNLSDPENCQVINEKEPPPLVDVSSACRPPYCSSFLADYHWRCPRPLALPLSLLPRSAAGTRRAPMYVCVCVSSH